MRPLYDKNFDKDNCGFGLMAHMDGVASHNLVHTSILALSRLTHRGAVAADGKSGDGCGILMRKPNEHLRNVCSSSGIDLNELYAVGMVFLSTDEKMASRARHRLETELVAEGFEVAGWRTVPVDKDVCGEYSLSILPRIEQIFVNAPQHLDPVRFDRHLYVARRRAKKIIEKKDDVFHVVTLSSQVICYKGLVLPHNLPQFYPDLNDENLKSSLCIFHQRFSTNTWPEWKLAQPFRYLAHNGEINTIQGNRNWAQARSHKFDTDLIHNMDDIRPWVSMTGSDSLSLDNMLEALLAGGMDIFLAMRLLIPRAWQNMKSLDPDLRAFYEYYSMHMEPWDGPAGVVLTDGRYAACVMDRNGLRPARYVITRDRHITLASEIGVYDYAPEDVVSKGRLKPGDMIAVDTTSGQLLKPDDIDNDLKARFPYKQWLNDHVTYLESSLEQEDACNVATDSSRLAIYRKMFQLSNEEMEQVVKVLAERGQEAVGSMGDDTPLPVFSRHSRSLYDYFRQQFAQVTNPPIDPLRESIVMSLETCFGNEQNLFVHNAEHATRIVVNSPVLSVSKFNQLLNVKDARFRHHVFELNYRMFEDHSTVISKLCHDVAERVRQGVKIIVLSDRNIAPDHQPLHALMATGAVHHHLISEGLRCDVNIVVETATARDPHHFAVLIGYGASAVYPYLAYDCICHMIADGEFDDKRASHAVQTYRKGINKGLYKILSKMGISTITSYRGAQLFEAFGLSNEVVDLCFTGTPSRLEGIDFNLIQAEQKALCHLAWERRVQTAHGGLLKYTHNGEYHAFNPDIVHALHKAVETGSYEDYQYYASLVNDRPVTVIRDLLTLKTGVNSIPLESVEPEESIFPRFETGAMSLGALSPEAHETLAIVMNRLGGRSNSGEGGEDPVRFKTEKVSKIKQVASGRFGVTPHYLVNADVIQIKISQGAKPGEGGQLAGQKVDDLIARLRYATIGTPLISPPPHHDIYSIEDLAQLIFDLKQVNPAALISVKLVSEPGVGTIAAGVAKAYADLITISGYDGGTGASPLTSVKYAGSPWELGLSETHQTLRANDLRHRVRLQTDGGLKTGLDVIKAAILGAESFGFGTLALLAMGCKYLRICHLNNCATGVATQDSNLRKHHFKGDVERVSTYFRFVAREVREWMAELGVTRLDELVGRIDLLEILPGETSKQRGLDLRSLLYEDDGSSGKPRYCEVERNIPYDSAELAEAILSDAMPAIDNRSGTELSYVLRNDNRSIGARLSGEIARRYGNTGMENYPIVIRFSGTAGQSFGVWNCGGLHLYLEGDANDYVGKGMAGGKIILYPPDISGFDSHSNVIIGNTCLYGATGGKLYASGLAGERLAVRNSGATAIVEGAGDHCCEYMTDGVVLVLGPTGMNFGAGMTGGFAFVLDMQNTFVDHYNHTLVDIHRIDTEDTEAHRNYLRMLITDYVKETGSRWGQEVLSEFMSYIGKFWLVKPISSSLEAIIDSMEQAA